MKTLNRIIKKEDNIILRPYIKNILQSRLNILFSILVCS